MQLVFGVLSNYNKGYVRIKLDELDGNETPWIPLLQSNAGNDKSGHPVDIGENVQAAAIMDDEFEQGVCLGFTYSDVTPCPTDSRDKEFHQFSDGTNIEYDRAGSLLKLDLAGGFSIAAADGSIDVPEIIINGTPILAWLNDHNHTNGNLGSNTGPPTQPI